jgi:hypothetical protein
MPVSNHRNLFREPGIVLIAQKNDVAAAQRYCLHKIANIANVLRARINPHRERHLRSEHRKNRQRIIVRAIVTRDQFIGRMNLAGKAVELLPKIKRPPL